MRQIDILNIFHDIKTQFGTGFLALGLHCKVGTYEKCAVLKLQNPHWTNDRMDVVSNKTGFFFSVWADHESLAQDRLLYNIHALKLRELANYQITDVTGYARLFRSKFTYFNEGWPNLSNGTNPQTLIEGWLEIKPKTLTADITNLLNRFTRLQHLFDAVYEEMRWQKINPRKQPS